MDGNHHHPLDHEHDRNDIRLSELSHVLRDVHSQNLATFQRILSKNSQAEKEQFEDPFWDIIVVTAGDLQQRLFYQHQIDLKLERGQIPRRAKYHIVDDPPNSRIGSGGSTCLVMKTLQDHYSDAFLSTARTLLIHAGGYSTRLPHVSARGKIFTSLPQAASVEGIQVLELKLVLYLHLLKTMPPGVFLTSADGIELFSSKSPFPSEPRPLTITSLAHPSSLAIGSTHGVYLLQDPEELVSADRVLPAKDQSVVLVQCREFLHKPSIDRMKSTSGVIFRGETEDMEDVVYTDSCYYFDPQTAKILARTWRSLSNDCDLEAWADVLSFQQDSKESTSPLPVSMDPHQQGRLLLSTALREANVALEVMVMNASKFYHVGTMVEFLEGVCLDRAFMSELHIRNEPRYIAQVGSNHRFINEGSLSSAPFPIYVENSTAHANARIEGWSMIVDTDLGQDAVIPQNTCVFTLKIREQAFVTFTISVQDDMKKCVVADSEDVNQNWIHRLKIYQSIPIVKMLSKSAQSYLESDLNVSIGPSVSLWTAPIFEIAPSKDKSIDLALERLDRIRHCLYNRDIEPQAIDPASDSRVIGWISLKEAARLAREL
ncbi:hypothetical protein BGZ83_002014 [Gryganskiella cystojenkinii]|nr:hypothetical protein BGZ83_002014 [Gryganskiella cystojenkinii]